ncbi:hypothetical protein PR048_023157 [Dryococelus australis]|uniref:Uncharacterized protein n=1 Tax=Dryococelus australis TaxID=614101 RepID=A0ABQ9GTB8_9NEOP|nr:hypothetical protein PR048_023157 [Dryococelus australis]
MEPQTWGEGSVVIGQDGSALYLSSSSPRYSAAPSYSQLHISAHLILSCHPPSWKDLVTSATRTVFFEVLHLNAAPAQFLLQLTAKPECEGEGTGDPRENPPTSGIVRHDYHLAKIRSDPAGDLTWFFKKPSLVRRTKLSIQRPPFKTNTISSHLYSGLGEYELICRVKQGFDDYETTLTDEAAEVTVLAAVAVNPHVSTRRLEAEIGIP